MEENNSAPSVRETLQRVADRGGYQLKTAWAEDRAWLLWPTREAFWPIPPKSDGEDILDRYFPLPADFDFNDALHAPTVGYARHYRRGRHPDPKEQREKLKALANKYQESDDSMTTEGLADLAAQRNALKIQIRYDGRRLRGGPLREIRSLLMVWLNEALDRRSSEGREGIALSWPQETAIHHARGLWQNISRGASVEELKEKSDWLDALFKHGSEVLARAQHDRIVEVLEDRDCILEKSAYLREKFRLCESILWSVLNDEEVPPFDDLRRRASGSDDKRVVHLPQKEWIVEKYWEIRKEHRGWINARIIEEVQMQYADRFGDELRKRHGEDVNVIPSEKTIRDYRDGKR